MGFPRDRDYVHATESNGPVFRFRMTSLSTANLYKAEETGFLSMHRSERVRGRADCEIIWSAQKQQSRSFLSTSGNDSPLFPSLSYSAALIADRSSPFSSGARLRRPRVSTGQGLKDRHSMMHGGRADAIFARGASKSLTQRRLRYILVMTRHGEHAAKLGDLFECHVVRLARCDISHRFT